MKLYLRQEHAEAMKQLQEECVASGDFDQHRWRHGLQELLGPEIEAALDAAFLAGYLVEQQVVTPGLAEYEAAPVLVGDPEEGAPIEAEEPPPVPVPGLKTPDYLPERREARGERREPDRSSTRARAREVSGVEEGLFEAPARLVVTPEREVYLQVHLTKETLRALLEALL